MFHCHKLHLNLQMFYLIKPLKNQSIHKNLQLKAFFSRKLHKFKMLKVCKLLYKLSENQILENF